MEKKPRLQREQEERRELLIDTAERLFLTKGYEETSIDDLAAASEYTKRTLYRYFTCKEDLYYAVTLRGFRELKRLVDEKCRSGGNGYEKVCLAIEAYGEMYKASPGMLKLINRGDAIKSGAAADLPYRLEAAACEKELFDALLKLYIEGQADGSIRRDWDAATLAFSAIFMTTGFFQLMAQSGGSFVRHFGLDMDAFVSCAMETLTERLRKG